MSERVLEIEHLSVVYRDNPLFGKKTSYQALTDINFHIDHGEIVGLVGESGSGKSTLLRALLALDPVQGGQVLLTIALDGETQGNAYQDRLADLKMNFAVQIADQPGTSTRAGNAPKTGDENNLFPYYVAMVISGFLFLYFALDSYTDRLYKKGKG